MNSSDNDHFNDNDKFDEYNIIHNKATDSDVKNSYNDEKNTAALNSIIKKAMKKSEICLLLLTLCLLLSLVFFR